MKYFLTIIAFTVVVGIGVLLYAWSGTYDIAATDPHWETTVAFLNLVRDRSVAVRSDGIDVPDLDALHDRKEAAISHYHGMCRHCHGAPGVSRNEFAEGLYPSPPDLTSGNVQKMRGQTELFWIIKHGIKMSGMPAFGPTHDTKELWDLVALTRAIPQMRATQYREMARNGTEAAADGHTHGDSTPGAAPDAAPQEHEHHETESEPHG